MGIEGPRGAWIAGVFAGLLALPLPAGESPDMELIEFLGEFTGEEGDWVDPMNLYLLEQDSDLLEEQAEPEQDEATPEEESDEPENR
jgi:hypothetical protein